MSLCEMLNDSMIWVWSSRFKLTINFVWILEVFYRLFSYLCFPFVDCIASNVASLFHLDTCAAFIVFFTLWSDTEIKSNAKPSTNRDFWHLPLKQKYPISEDVPSTSQQFLDQSICVRLFSLMDINKLIYRSTMTNDHLVACLRLTTSYSCLDYENLASSPEVPEVLIR